MKKSGEKIQWRKQFIDLIAIFVGVYIAFALSGWKVSYEKETSKKQYILSLREDLKSDKAKLNEGLLALDTLIQKIDRLAHKEILRIPNDSMDYYMRGLLSQPTFYPANFTFQSMINDGDMGGLSNLAFRKDVLGLYHGQYVRIKELDEINIRNFQDHIITTIIDKGSFDGAYLASRSFPALVLAVNDFHNQRKKLYTEAIIQIDKIHDQVEQMTK